MPLVIKRSLLLFFYTFSGLAPHFSQAAKSNLNYRFYSDDSTQVAYYKSKNSQFLSGKATLTQLKQNLISSSQQKVVPEDSYYQHGEQKISKKLLSPTFANSLSIKPGYADLGKFMVLKPSALKKDSSIQSPTLSFVPAGELVYPLGHKNGFIKVIYKKQKGYIDISSTLSKLDYAYAVYCEHPQLKIKQWYHVKNRIFDQIQLKDGHQVPLSKIEGIYTDDRIGIVTQPKDSLPLWTKVILKKEFIKLETWNQSYLKGEGLVWWKTETSTSSPSLQTTTIDDLLKKEVYSVSFHSKDPKKAIASTVDGVYISSNGMDWKLIPQFQGFKGPVLYYNDNLIFIGSHKSTDGGKTFDQFINVAAISDLIHKKAGFNPTFLKIKKIQTASSSKINIDLDTGLKTVKLQSPIYSQNWDIVKN